MNIVSSEMAPMLTKYRAREHQALMVYWGPDYMDPHTNADGFVTNIDNTDAATGGKPLAWRNSWENAELTAATKAAAEEADEAKRAWRTTSSCRRRCSTKARTSSCSRRSRSGPTGRTSKGFVQGSSADVTYYNLTTK